MVRLPARPRGRGILALRRAGRALRPAHELQGRGLPPDGIRARLRDPGLVPPERHVPDLPRPLRPRLERHGQGRHRKAPGDGPPGQVPRGLGRERGLAAQQRGRLLLPAGLLRRHPARHRRPPQLPPGPRRQRHLLKPRLRGLLQPPLRHGGLPQHRPHPRLKRGLRGALRRGREARHPHHARRRVLPHGRGQHLLQQVLPLPGRGRLQRGRELALLRLVRLPPLPAGIPLLVELPRPARGG